MIEIVVDSEFVFFRYEDYYVYEIYPQSETPQLIQIAHLNFDFDFDSSIDWAGTYLLHDKVIWYAFYQDRVVFRVCDFRVSHSISFSSAIDINRLAHSVEVNYKKFQHAEPSDSIVE